MFFVACLQSIHIDNCWRLNPLLDDLFDGLSSLHTFKITGCIQVIRIPDSLKRCTSLKEVHIVSCPLIVASPADFNKLINLSQLTFGLASRKLLKMKDYHYINDLAEELRIRPNHKIDDLGEVVLGEMMAKSCSMPLFFENPGEQLKYILSGLQSQPDLHLLAIDETENEEEFMESFSDMTLFNNLESLRFLILYGCSGIKALPQQLRSLACVITLGISSFPDLEEIPEWIFEIPSLEILHLLNCKQLTRLPSKDHLLNLRELRISSCPELATRYAKGVGPEWYSIQHVSYIKIDGRIINDKNNNGRGTKCNTRTGP